MQALTQHDRPALRLAVAQTAPRLRAVAANAAHLADLARSADADLLLTPELSLTGYDVGDSVHHLGTTLTRDTPAGIEALADLPGELVVGLIEAASGGPYNTAVSLRGGVVRFTHRKIHLPTYGMFDEDRWFGRGGTLDSWQPVPGWTCGLLICEDFWHPGLAYVLASRGIDLLLVQAAAPGRGVWEGGAAGSFASADAWERIARTTAQLYGIYVALCNRVGVEGGVTFAGGSLVVGPDGAVLERAGESECVIAAELTHSELQRARRPYAHARDDDPHLVVRELRRGLAS
jgi:NAD+ synthase (glutamine-hydrolysing)